MRKFFLGALTVFLLSSGANAEVDLTPQKPLDSYSYKDRQVDFLVSHFFGYAPVIPEGTIGKASEGYGVLDWFFYLQGDFVGKYVTFPKFKEKAQELYRELPESISPGWYYYDQKASGKKIDLILSYYTQSCLFQPDAEKQKVLKPRLYYSYIVKTQQVRSSLLKLLKERILEEERELYQLKKYALSLCGSETPFPEGVVPTAVEDKATLLQTDKNISRSSCFGAGGFSALTGVFSSVSDAVGNVLESVVDTTKINDILSRLDPQEIIRETLEKAKLDPSILEGVIGDKLKKLSPDRLKETALTLIKEKLGDKVDLSYYEELYNSLSPEQLQEIVKEQIDDAIKEGKEEILEKLPGIADGEALKEYLLKELLKEALENNPTVQKLKEKISTLFKAYLDFYRRVNEFYEELYSYDLYQMTKCIRDSDDYYFYYPSSYYYDDYLYIYTTNTYVKQVQEALCSIVKIAGKKVAEELFNVAKVYAQYNSYGRVKIEDGRIKIQDWWETANIGLENLVFDRDSIDEIVNNIVDYIFAKKLGINPSSIDELLSLPQREFEQIKSVLEEGTGDVIKNLYGGFPAYKRDTVMYYKPITSRVKLWGEELSKEERKKRADACLLLISRLENIGQEIRMQKRILYNLTRKYRKLTEQEKTLIGAGK